MSYTRLEEAAPATCESYWFVAAPGEPTRQDMVARLKEKLSLQSGGRGVADVCELSTVAVPDFKIGTLDHLVVLSDELTKADAACEAAVLKLADSLKTLLHGDVEQWRASLTLGDKSVDAYVRTFQWNAMKYRTDKSLRELSALLADEVAKADGLMKGKLAAYAAVKGQLVGVQRKQTGNLSSRALAGFVRKEQLVLGSEYLTTLLVAVPRAAYAQWWEKYELLTQMVVPRSSQLVAEDEEFGLFSVTLFKRVETDFANRCREERFVVRDFVWDEEQMARDRREAVEVAAAEKELWTQVVRLAKINFGEVFACWVHLKILRVCVESVLRFGLPPNFQTVVLRPQPKAARRLKDTLAVHYARLARRGGQLGDVSAAADQLDESLQGILADLGGSEPYVFFEIVWDTSGGK